MLSMHLHEIGYVWLEALLLDEEVEKNADLARKILGILQSEIGRKLNPSDFGGLLPEILLDYMEEILQKEVGEIDIRLLGASWGQVRELFRMLSYERYIDDQMEIDEVWRICQALIKRGRFGEEDWETRKNILREMISHECPISGNAFGQGIQGVY